MKLKSFSWKEFNRIILFLLIVTFYFTSKFGYCIGVIHLFLAIQNSEKYGMSKLLIRILK
ncbi:MAG: Uncharacterised protein [Polaribacter sp. SA4-10]|nr:MAG: Uncharacterised protein [Polaribacter sp. SA4-10]